MRPLFVVSAWNSGPAAPAVQAMSPRGWRVDGNSSSLNGRPDRRETTRSAFRPHLVVDYCVVSDDSPARTLAKEAAMVRDQPRSELPALATNSRPLRRSIGGDGDHDSAAFRARRGTRRERIRGFSDRHAASGLGWRAGTEPDLPNRDPFCRRLLVPSRPRRTFAADASGVDQPDCILLRGFDRRGAERSLARGADAGKYATRRGYYSARTTARDNVLHCRRGSSRRRSRTSCVDEPNRRDNDGMVAEGVARQASMRRVWAHRCRDRASDRESRVARFPGATAASRECAAHAHAAKRPPASRLVQCRPHLRFRTPI